MEEETHDDRKGVGEVYHDEDTARSSNQVVDHCENHVEVARTDHDIVGVLYDAL